MPETMIQSVEVGGSPSNNPTTPLRSIVSVGSLQRHDHLTRVRTPMSTEARIREYILQNYLFTDDESALKSEDSFLEKGILDSTGILELIFFIEEAFEMSIGDEEMIPENLDSVNNLVAFIGRKVKG